MSFKLLFVCLLIVLLSVCSCAKKPPAARALSPQEALKSFRLSEDFHVELFASEPDLVDPVEMAFDENGRTYVAEMLDYPEDPPPGRPARSRIRLLEDTDGDGKIDRSVVFADHLLEVSSVLPWKGGILVGAAPDILYLKDTDGDGRADLRRVLYTGFPLVNPEGRITNLRLGIDNWVYAANNGADGRITSPEHPERPPILVRGADFRFRPDRDQAEAAAGPAQFGLTFDNWGNRFITHNTVHLRHVVLPMEYLARAPLLEVRAVAQDISDHGRPSARMFPLTQPQTWRVERTRLRQQRFNEQHVHRTEFVAGYFTAAAGSTVYNGDVFPREYWGNVFTGDVSGNLVHRDILTPDGVTFSAHRARDGVEFLASTDPWFRPCTFANAPDGNLYMIDIYREFIETPESIPEAIKKNLNFWSGDTLGRIYRLVPNHPLLRRDLRPRLGSTSTAELVRLLESTNGWHRQTAQRLLLERAEPSSLPLLREVAAKSSFAPARIHALWLLEALGGLEPDAVIAALRDSDPHVREHALRLAENFLAISRPAADAVFARLPDPDVRVQFQFALTLGVAARKGGALEGRALDALAGIAASRAADPWFGTAILASAHQAPWRFARALEAKRYPWSNGEFLGQLASLIGARRDPPEIAGLLNLLGDASRPAPGLAGLARGLKLAGGGRAAVSGAPGSGAEAALLRFINSPDEKVREAAWETARYLEIRALIRRAEAEAASPKAPAALRAIALRVLRGAPYAEAAPILRKAIEPGEPAEVQAAAIESLAAFDSPESAAALLANWRLYGPGTRTLVVEALLARRDRAAALLDALEGGRVEPGALEVAARARLLEHPDARVVQRARRFFQAQGGDRPKLVDSYRDVLNLRGDPSGGKTVFEQSCARCHMPRRQAGRVGPDLSGISNKTKEELLTSILNPSYAIEPRFVNYIVTTRDGAIHDGILVNETPGAITLRAGTNEADETILRRNIAEIRASRISLMPENFEKTIGHQAMADLISYLRGGL